MGRTHILFATVLFLVAGGIVAGLVALAVSTEEDVTRPVISDVSAILVRHYDAVVSWTTDEPATTKVSYYISARGGMASYGGAGEVNPWGGQPLSTSHVIGIGFPHSTLEPDTTYTYTVTSVDGAGNEAVSDEYTFTTLPLAMGSLTELQVVPLYPG